MGKFWNGVDRGLGIAVTGIFVFLYLGFVRHRRKLTGSWPKTFGRLGHVLTAGLAMLSAFFGSALFAISEVERGLVPWWADSLAIPILSALLGAVFVVPAAMSVFFFLSFLGNPQAPIFAWANNDDHPWWNEALAILVAMPFAALGLLMVVSAWEFAFAGLLFLYLALEIRANIIGKWGRPKGEAAEAVA